MAPERFLTVPEVAELLRCSVWVVTKKCRDGEIVASKPHKSWLMTETAVADYVKAHLNVDEKAAS